MIKQLRTKNFTVLKDACLSFSPHLNVIIGENGAGKTHVLKLLYSILSAYTDVRSGKDKSECQLPRLEFRQKIAEKLLHVFLPDRIGRLTTRVQGRNRTEVGVSFSDKGLDTQFFFATNSKSDVSVDRYPEGLLSADVERAVYFPAKELLSIYPNFTSLYEEYHLPYDETYRDTMRLLGLPYTKGPRDEFSATLLDDIEKAMGGTIRLDPSGKAFHLIVNDSGKQKGDMEIELVAEGWRKLGMLTQVILNRALRNQGYLFWDEPEANLNPKLIRILAEVIFRLATESESKAQIFVTTHSLFFLRELEFLAQKAKDQKAIRYFALGQNSQIEQSDSSTGLSVVTALEEEISQSLRILSLDGDREG